MVSSIYSIYMKINYNAVVDFIINNEVKKATKYISPKLIVRAVRKSQKGGKPRKTDNIEISLTIGKPNYVEREFIKLCEASNEPFPVKKIQVKEYYLKKKINGKVAKK